MKVYLHSFGCRVNQYEGERLRSGFISGGGTVVEDFRQADLSVINTCTVTDEADKEIRTVIRKIYRDNPAGKVVITGCYASRAPEELQALFPEALIVGNDAKDTIPALAGCSMGLSETASGRSINTFFGHSRAMVKVQDGCDMVCTYCIIPTTRPVMSCRAPGEILEEVKSLLENGYQEIVLCGIRLGRYWASEPRHSREGGNPGLERQVDLLELIQRISAFPGDFRIRLSSIEISDFTDRFIEGYNKTAKTVPYFHIPLQSGSDAVLSAMKRWYDTGFYRKRIAEIRKALGPDTAFYTDFMIGFPTETEEEFNRSLEFAKEIGFAGMHIFRYSPRQGTPAAQMAPVYTPKELERRMQAARALDREFRESFASRFAGRALPVLVESVKEGVSKARAENFLEVLIENASAGAGWRLARIAESKGPKLIGSLDPGLLEIPTASLS